IKNGNSSCRIRWRTQSITKDQIPSPLDWIQLWPGGAAKPAACVDFHVRAWLCSSYLCDGDLSFDDPCQTFASPFLCFNQSFGSRNRVRLLIWRGTLRRDTVTNECSHAPDRFQQAGVLNKCYPR